ncbi:hypothetical protein [Leptospira neocaledonica]|uniref:Uncharacterized protein n=1 Tax=Leptospira neocaledonica TaxID=2023192 RepID=A0A2M9ZZS3_9LEPT|nr:hypothetical protein [Leptospira neocaledonica]PJZ77491.1 hypothetical protein CH365_07885 [Leptospira neocaledonica]
MANKTYLIIGLIFSLYRCVIIDLEAQLQNNLITRKEAVEKIRDASILKIALCLEKNEFSDVLNFTDYTDYLICNGSCTNSNYYRLEDVNYLYNSILFLPCDFSSKFLIPKINPFKIDDVQLKYLGF